MAKTRREASELGALINKARKGIRTPDLRFTKPLLCQLSYPGE